MHYTRTAQVCGKQSNRRSRKIFACNCPASSLQNCIFRNLWHSRNVSALRNPIGNGREATCLKKQDLDDVYAGMRIVLVYLLRCKYRYFFIAAILESLSAIRGTLVHDLRKKIFACTLIANCDSGAILLVRLVHHCSR